MTNPEINIVKLVLHFGFGLQILSISVLTLHPLVIEYCDTTRRCQFARGLCLLIRISTR